jgi:hypothetical protein
MNIRNPKNERIKRQYSEFLKHADGRAETTIRQIEKAIQRYEKFTRADDFAPYISTLLAERAIGTVSQFVKYRRERRGYLASFLRRKLTIRGIRESIIEGLR